jgi:hypothetical protein
MIIRVTFVALIVCYNAIMKTPKLLSHEVPGFNMDTLRLMSLLSFPIMIVAYIFLSQILSGIALFISIGVFSLLITSLASIVVGKYAMTKPPDSKWRKLV